MSEEKVWTEEMETLFNLACKEFGGEPSFKQINEDARFKGLAGCWLFDRDERSFNLEVQRQKTDVAEVAMAEKVANDAAIVRAKKKNLKKPLRKAKKTGGIWNSVMKNLSIRRKVKVATGDVDATLEMSNELLRKTTLEMKNNELLRKISRDLDRLNLTMDKKILGEIRSLNSAIEEIAEHLVQKEEQEDMWKRKRPETFQFPRK